MDFIYNQGLESNHQIFSSSVMCLSKIDSLKIRELTTWVSFKSASKVDFQETKNVMAIV